MAFTRYHSLGGLNSSSVSPESSGSGKAESRASSGFVLPEASLLGVQTAAFPVFSRRQAARGAGGDDTCHQEASSEGGELQRVINSLSFVHLTKQGRIAQGLKERL